jgi:hypothetical protein
MQQDDVSFEKPALEVATKIKSLLEHEPEGVALAYSIFDIVSELISDNDYVSVVKPLQPTRASLSEIYIESYFLVFSYGLEELISTRPNRWSAISVCTDEILGLRKSQSLEREKQKWIARWNTLISKGTDEEEKQDFIEGILKSYPDFDLNLLFSSTSEL